MVGVAFGGRDRESNGGRDGVGVGGLSAWMSGADYSYLCIMAGGKGDLRCSSPAQGGGGDLVRGDQAWSSKLLRDTTSVI